MSKRNGGTLEHWWIESRIFTKHEGPKQVVVGLSIGHPRFDGRRIRTSPVVDLDEKAGTVETEHSFYLLGTKVDPETFYYEDE